MSKRTVAHALFTYQDEKGGQRMALRGQEIELSGDELKRAEELGAVVDGDLDGPTGGPVVAPTPPVDPEVAGELTEDGKKAAADEDAPASARRRGKSAGDQTA